MARLPEVCVRFGQLSCFGLAEAKLFELAKYRLTSGKVAAAPVRVPVVPLVRFYQARIPDQLRGYVRPVMLAGSTVLIQRQQGPGWATVGSSGHGFVAGTTPVLQVSTS
jgi:hypothetical protein